MAKKTKHLFTPCPVCKNWEIIYRRYFNVQLAICEKCRRTVQVKGTKKDLIEEWNRGDYNHDDFFGKNIP